MTIVKPSRAFDRDVEWSAVVNFLVSAEPDVRVGVVTGRRRQGKTFLLHCLGGRVRRFYFTAALLTSADALREFGTGFDEALRSEAGAIGSGWSTPASCAAPRGRTGSARGRWPAPRERSRLTAWP